MTRSSENIVRECHQLQVPAKRTFEVFTGRLPTHSWFAKETHHFIFFCKPTATIWMAKTTRRKSIRHKHFAWGFMTNTQRSQQSNENLEKSVQL